MFLFPIILLSFTINYIAHAKCPHLLCLSSSPRWDRQSRADKIRAESHTQNQPILHRGLLENVDSCMQNMLIISDSYECKKCHQKKSLINTNFTKREGWRESKSWKGTFWHLKIKPSHIYRKCLFACTMLLYSVSFACIVGQVYRQACDPPEQCCPLEGVFSWSRHSHNVVVYMHVVEDCF